LKLKFHRIGFSKRYVKKQFITCDAGNLRSSFHLLHILYLTEN